VPPVVKSTFTCGVAVFAWFAITNTRTHALRSFTRGTIGSG